MLGMSAEEHNNIETQDHIPAVGIKSAVQDTPVMAEGTEQINLNSTNEIPNNIENIKNEQEDVKVDLVSQASSEPAPVAKSESAPNVEISDPTNEEALLKEQMKYCGAVLRNLKRHPQGVPFLLPVDPVALNIPDYPNVIKNPMDLSTINKKLDANEYPNPEAFFSDVRLMLNNCFTYNHPESQVAKMGRSLEKYFNGAVSKLPLTLPPKTDNKAQARRKSESNASNTPSASRARRESHAPSRLASIPTVPSPRGRARSTNPEISFCNQVMRELMKKTHAAVSWPFMEPVDPVKLGIPDYFDVIKHPMDLSTIKKKLDNGQYSNADQFEADIRLIFTNCYTYNAADSDVVSLCKAFEKIFNTKWMSKPLSFAYTSGSVDGSDSDSEKIFELSQKINQMQQELNVLIMKKRNRTSNAAARPPKKPKSSSKPAAPVITEEEFLSRPMTFEEKRQLSIEVNNLAPEKLGKVVEIIQAGMALEAQADSEVIELDIESLNTRTLRQLQKYVSECRGITSLAAILGENAPKRKKPTAPSNESKKAANPAPSATAAAAVAMSSEEESSEDELD